MVAPQVLRKHRGTEALFPINEVKNIRIQRPAYKSEVHATRDMGVGDSTIVMRMPNLPIHVAVGCNSLETKPTIF